MVDALSTGDMGRRSFLTSGLAAFFALSGCTSDGEGHDSFDSLSLTSISNSELPEKVLDTIGARDSYRGIDASQSTATLMARIIDEGTTIQAAEPPLPRDRKLIYQDIIYELTYDVVEQAPAASYVVSINPTESVTESETISFNDLPTVDQEKFTERGLGNGDPLGFTIRILYTDAQADSSVLVPDPEYSYIVWEDGPAATWVVENRHETTMKTYQYSAEQVTDVAAYGNQLREQYGFELSGLSDAQRDIITTAITDEEYVLYEDDDTPSAFVKLADQFSDYPLAREYPPHPLRPFDYILDGPYIVQYDDGIYWAEFHINRYILITNLSGFETKATRDTTPTIEVEISMSDAMPFNATGVQVEWVRSLIGQEGFTDSEIGYKEINVNPGQTKQTSITTDRLDPNLDRFTESGIRVQLLDVEDRLLAHNT